MEIKNKDQLQAYLNQLKFLGAGFQGECYLDPYKSLVYKFFYGIDEEDYEEFRKEHILQFSDINNTTFIFPIDVIMYQNRVIGYVTKYAEASNLYQLDPLKIDLDRLVMLIKKAILDIELITKNGVKIYDMMYNIMLGKQIYVIDTLEYTKGCEDYDTLLKDNMRAFNLEMMYFLIDGFFDGVLEENDNLARMYNSHGYDMDILEFIKVLKTYLASILGKEIKNLSIAENLMDEQPYDSKYARTLILK